MNRAIAKIGFAAITLPLLAGCLDMTQSLSVTSDGQATFGVEVAVLTEMFGQMFPDGEDEFCPEEFEEELPPGFTAEVEYSTRDGYQICTQTATGPLDEFITFLAEGGMAEDGILISVSDDGGGEYTFSVDFSAANDDLAIPLGANGEEDIPPELQQMMVLLEGHFLTWTLTAPRIIETDGELDGNTASYRIPLEDMVTGLPEEEQSFFVRFGL